MDLQTKIIVFVTVPGLFLLIVAQPFERSFLIYLGFLVVEGLIKLTANFHPIAHLSRNILMVALLHSFVRTGPRTLFGQLIPRMSANHVVWAFVLLLVVMLIHPGSDNLMVAAATWKIHLEFVPLFFMGYALIRRLEMVEKITTILYLAGILIGGLMILQLVFGFNAIANLGPGFQYPIQHAEYSSADESTTYIRAFGTSSGAGGGGVWAALIFPFLLSEFLLPKQHKKRNRLFLLVVLGCCIMGLFFAFARQTFLASAISVPVVVFMVRKLSPISGRLLGIAILVSSVLLCLHLADRITQGAIVKRFSGAFADPLKEYDKNRGHALRLVPWVARNYPLGHGLGGGGTGGGMAAAINRGGVFSVSSSRRETGGGVNTEVYPLTILWDGGIPGLLIVAILFIILARQALSLTNHCLDVRYQQVVAKLSGTLFVVFVLCFGQSALTGFPCSAFFWMFGGMLCAMPLAMEEGVLRQQMAELQEFRDQAAAGSLPQSPPGIAPR